MRTHGYHVSTKFANNNFNYSDYLKDFNEKNTLPVFTEMKCHHFMLLTVNSSILLNVAKQ